MDKAQIRIDDHIAQLARRAVGDLHVQAVFLHPGAALELAPTGARILHAQIAGRPRAATGVRHGRRFRQNVAIAQSRGCDFFVPFAIIRVSGIITIRRQAHAWFAGDREFLRLRAGKHRIQVRVRRPILLVDDFQSRSGHRPVKAQVLASFQHAQRGQHRQNRHAQPHPLALIHPFEHEVQHNARQQQIQGQQRGQRPAPVRVFHRQAGKRVAPAILVALPHALRARFGGGIRFLRARPQQLAPQACHLRRVGHGPRAQFIGGEHHQPVLRGAEEQVPLRLRAGQFIHHQRVRLRGILRRGFSFRHFSPPGGQLLLAGNGLLLFGNAGNHRRPGAGRLGRILFVFPRLGKGQKRFQDACFFRKRAGRDARVFLKERIPQRGLRAAAHHADAAIQ